MGCGASAKGGGGADAKTGKGADASKGDAKGGKHILDNDGKKIGDFYDMDKKKLGEGSYGSVSKCTNKSTGAVRACKTLSKTQMAASLERFKLEIQIMKLMDHPHIIKLYENFEDTRNIYLVMELCSGGELFDRIIDSGHFTETQAAIVMQHMLRAMFYMHQNNVTHRDLKPENFLLSSKEPIGETTLKIIDFGLACQFKPGDVLKTKAGTPYYVAPQVLQGKYDQSADIWSCGVIMFVLLCGYPPFYGETDAEVLSKVKIGNFSFRAADWKNISKDAKDLIRMLLKMTPKERFTAEQALNHVWVKDKAPAAVDMPLQSSMFDNLKGFRSQNKLKKAALHVIANQLSENQIKDLRDTFMALDSDGDGMLTHKELKSGLEKAGFKEIPPDLQSIMEQVDADGSGCIDYTEFLAATLDKKTYHQEDVCWAAFRVFDRNGDGKISKDEIAHVLGDGDVQSVAVKDLTELMQEIDNNGDGEIDFEEFMAMMKGGGGEMKKGGSGDEVEGGEAK